MSKMKHITWDESAGAARNAPRELPAVVAAYFAQGRQAAGKKAKDSDLDALRLTTERLRYTLELFRACYGPGLRARLAALRRLQDCLEQVSDCGTAARSLADYSRKSSAHREEIDRFLTRQRSQKAGEFRRFWSEEFDAPGRERWWAGYLARHTRRPGRKA